MKRLNKKFHESYNTHLTIPNFTELAKSVPRIEIVLEPGDVLINPPMWYHEVENISETSIAMASRWIYSHFIRGSNTNQAFANILFR